MKSQEKLCGRGSTGAKPLWVCSILTEKRKIEFRWGKPGKKMFRDRNEQHIHWPKIKRSADYVCMQRKPWLLTVIPYKGIQQWSRIWVLWHKMACYFSKEETERQSGLPKAALKPGRSNHRNNGAFIFCIILILSD